MVPSVKPLSYIFSTMMKILFCCLVLANCWLGVNWCLGGQEWLLLLNPFTIYSVSKKNI